MKLLQRIRQYPERTRKMIVFSIVAIVGILLIVWWISSMQDRFDNIQLPQITI